MTTETLRRLQARLVTDGHPSHVNRVALTKLMKRRYETVTPHWRGDDQDERPLGEALVSQWVGDVSPAKTSALYPYLGLIEEASRAHFTPPQHLVDEIKSGRCVAFIGAGFSAPALPGWMELLRTLLECVPQSTTSHLSEEEVSALLAGESTTLDLEIIGQIILNAYKPAEPRDAHDDFERVVSEVLQESEKDKKPQDVELRAQLLRSIPFDSVITTNYDHFLSGDEPEPQHYSDYLRTTHRWWDQRRWSGDTPQSTQRTLKIHGDANGSGARNPIILARADYRSRVYGDRSYANFLKSLFASKTILFLGVSFRDAYLNELRSEVLDMIGTTDHGHPRAYAILADKTEAWSACFREVEGIEVLSYQSTHQGRGHRGFDRWLSALSDATCAETQLKSSLEGQRVIWLDPHSQQNNQYGFEWLSHHIGAHVEELSSVEALDRSRHQEAALLITSFGFQEPIEASLALRALREVNQWPGGRPPVIVFSGHEHARENRRQVLRHGAHELAVSWGELFRVIHDLFSREVGQ